MRGKGNEEIVYFKKIVFFAPIFEKEKTFFQKMSFLALGV
jgi:hypothetical protein